MLIAMNMWLSLFVATLIAAMLIGLVVHYIYNHNHRIH